MNHLAGYQVKYLRGLAHHLKPSVLIGRKGITPALIQEIREELDRHELIKIKFVDFKEKSHKEKLSALIEETSQSRCIGTIGHMAIFYKQNRDPEKRKIAIPTRSTSHDEASHPEAFE
ncbi:MAG: YhbY family RNA-binding protein [Deltaproteobacteria bacterium]|nr:YhbY family RNA-binding protein [Deltaproteobacteria bacterium]